MHHFSMDKWVDFARGMPPDEAAEMRIHLDRGCHECRQSLQTWQTISALAAREAAYQPSGSVVETVKAAFNSEKRWAWLAQIAQMARLVFDSFQQAEPAMMRGFPQPSRQLVHESEPFVIDLRLESDPLRKRISLLGQILNSRYPENAIRGVDVILLRGEDVIQKTSTNPLGEFVLEFGRDENLRLFINIRGQRAIGIVLPEVEN